MSLYFEEQTATIAQNATTSDEVDLKSTCDFVRVVIPTIDTATVKLTVSRTSGGTFVDLGSGMTTASGTGNYATMFKLGGYRYVKVVVSASQTSGEVVFQLMGMKI